jgi:hypothetical protein
MIAAHHDPDQADPHFAERAAFARAVRDMPETELSDTIRLRCVQGGGHWQNPAPLDHPGGPTGRPATHLFEISFLGLTATGTSPTEAARNWRRCALNQIESNT